MKNTSIKRTLSKEWISSGLKPGGMALIHSDVRLTCLMHHRKGLQLTMEDLLDSFLEAVGREGTLLFPSFNFSAFPEEKVFDIRHTPSEMGSLTEAARLHPDAVRTGHPLYSFAVIGKQAHRFMAVNNKSGYGKNSPFGILHEENGQIAALGIEDQESLTFVHHVEEMNGVPYRYFKRFKGLYTDREGLQEEREYSLFVRKLEKGVETNFIELKAELWKDNLYEGCPWNKGNYFRTIDAGKLFRKITQIIQSGNAEGTLMKYNRNQETS